MVWVQDRQQAKLLAARKNAVVAKDFISNIAGRT